jgi:hypothetical protein
LRNNFDPVACRGGVRLRAIAGNRHDRPSVSLQPQTIPVIAHAIQLAIAPVFLLTGIAALLGVMANRLARIIDRARHYEDVWEELDEDARQVAREELGSLEHRRHLAAWAINFCTTGALLVCTVIAALFADEFFEADLKWLAGALFVGAMLALIGGLACFLREVYVSTHTVRIVLAKFRS